MNNLCCIKLIMKEFREKTCRICLCEVTQPSLVYIFSENPFCQNQSLLEILKAISPADVKIDKSDTLPVNICLKCSEQLRSIATFRNKIKESDFCLRVKLQSSVYKISSSKELIATDIDNYRKENVTNLVQCKPFQIPKLKTIQSKSDKIPVYSISTSKELATMERKNVLYINHGTDDTGENIENKCKLSKQIKLKLLQIQKLINIKDKSDAIPVLKLSSSNELLTTGEDVIYVDNVNNFTSENIENVFKAPEQIIFKPHNKQKLETGLSKLDVSCRILSSKELQVTEDNINIENIGDNAKRNIKDKHELPIQFIPKPMNELLNTFQSNSDVLPVWKITNISSGEAVKESNKLSANSHNVVVNSEKSLEVSKENNNNSSPKEGATDYNSTVEQNDSLLIKELLSSSISDSIILANDDDNSVNHVYPADLSVAEFVSPTLSKQQIHQFAQKQHIADSAVQYPCPKCNQKFSNLGFLKRHQEYHELNLIELQEKLRRRFYNEACLQHSEGQQLDNKLQTNINHQSDNYQQLSNNQQSDNSQQLKAAATLQTFPKPLNIRNVSIPDLSKQMDLCRHCKQSFPLEQLSWHIYLKHNNIKNFLTVDIQKCKYCSDQLWEFDMGKHIKNNHMREHKRAVKKRLLERNSCSVCKKQFLSEKLLKHHYQSKHEVKFYCNHCKQGFVKNVDLNLHLKNIHKIKIRTEALCSICGKIVSSTYLNYHYQTHIKKHVRCSVKGCNAVLKYHTSLKDHIIRKHGTGKPTCICEYCGKGFALQQSLIGHQRSHFEFNKYRFFCPICKKRFYTTKHLKSHIKVHRRTKLFNCPFCTVVFAYKQSMNKHVTNYHPEHRV